MSGVHKFAKKFDPLGYAVAEGVFGIDKSRKQAESAEAAARAQSDERTASDARAAAALETKQVETRSQNVRAAASAAGATRSGNEQDYLSAKAPVKRRYASRVLLGE